MVALIRNVPIFKYLVPSWWHSLGRLRRVASPEEACPWWLALRAYSLRLVLVCSLLCACSRGREPRAPTHHHAYCYIFLP